MGDHIEKNEMGGTYGTYGRQERFSRDLVGRPEGKRRVWWGNLKIGDN